METIPDNEFYGWFHSMEMMLGSVSDQRSIVSSISDVPDQLRKWNEKAYVPKVVSIGPLHRGNRELRHMEDIKWRCVLFLMCRTEYPQESFRNCGKAIFGLDTVVRESYDKDIKLNSHDLAKIMLLDGCFLLELLISSDKDLDRCLRNDPNEEEGSPGAEVGKRRGQVLSDLKLLENQIPFFILTVLFQILFADKMQILQNRNEFQKIVERAQYFFGLSSRTQFQKIVNVSALYFFGLSSIHQFQKIVNERPEDERTNFMHFLDLMHWFMTREESFSSSEEENDHHLALTVDGIDLTIEPKGPKLKLQLKRCAARLEAAGVVIAPLQADHEKRGSTSICLENRKEAITLGCGKKFIREEGKLLIQPLHSINETTEIQWRNLIAWEKNRTTHEIFLKEGYPTRCKFSQYALLFKDLVCCEHDIRVLKDRGVLLVDDGEERSNEDLMILFQEIARGIEVDSIGDGRFRQLLEDLNNYSGASENPIILSDHQKSISKSIWKRRKANIHYKCIEELAIFKREYTPHLWKKIGLIGGILLLGLTIAQTVFAAISL